MRTIKIVSLILPVLIGVSGCGMISTEKKWDDWYVLEMPSSEEVDALLKQPSEDENVTVSGGVTTTVITDHNMEQVKASDYKGKCELPKELMAKIDEIPAGSPKEKALEILGPESDPISFSFRSPTDRPEIGVWVFSTETMRLELQINYPDPGNADSMIVSTYPDDSQELACTWTKASRSSWW